MSEQWRNLLERSRKVAKLANDESQSDDQIAESVDNLCASFCDVNDLMNRHLSYFFRAPSEEGEKSNEDIDDLKKVLIVDSRKALRFILSLLSIESTREEVQSQACSKYELHKPISKLICLRQCDSKCRLIAAQILCNIGTANEMNARKIFHEIQPSPTELEVRNTLLEKVSGHEPFFKFQSLDLASTWSQMIQSSGGSGSRKILGCIVAALHNAFASIESNSDDSKCVSHLASTLSSDKMLVCNMIRYILPSDVIANDGEEGIAVEVSELSDDGTEWISRLIEKFCAFGMLPKMYNCLGLNPLDRDDEDSAQEYGFVSITPEQLVLLHCAGSAVAEYTRTLHSENHCGIHPLGGACNLEDSKETYRFLAIEYCNIRQKVKSAENNSSESYGGENMCLENASTLILDLLSDSLSVDEHIGGGKFVEIRQYVGQTTCIIQNLLLDLGVLIDKLGILNRGVKARDLKIEESVQHLVTTVIQLIGNICYRCPGNQDLIRITKVPLPNVSNNVQEYTQLSHEKDDMSDDDIRNGLHVLLSCTSFAYGCFTLREWSIIAIRNVLEGNEENQKIVEELEAQQALDTPELKKLGVKVNLDKKGQVKVTHCDRN